MSPKPVYAPPKGLRTPLEDFMEYIAREHNINISKTSQFHAKYHTITNNNGRNLSRPPRLLNKPHERLLALILVIQQDPRLPPSHQDMSHSISSISIPPQTDMLKSNTQSKNQYRSTNSRSSSPKLDSTMRRTSSAGGTRMLRSLVWVRRQLIRRRGSLGGR
jgi:hypothetical protein